MAEEVTLDYVAKKAGVSRAAASRALNDRPGVAQDVRDRIKLIAESLDYRPNRAAQNLAGGRTRVVGLVLGGSELQTDRYASSLVQAVANAADSYDEGLMLLLAGQEPGRAVQNLLRDGLVDGVIISAMAMRERWVEELHQTDMAKVLLGAHPPAATMPRVDVENCESSAEMVGHLLDNGLTRVGVITGPLERVDAQLRLEGFQLAHERRGVPVDESLIQHGTFRLTSGYEGGQALFAQGVDGIFASNDEMALGALRAARERGLDCPGEVSIAGFDGTSVADNVEVRLTTVVQPFLELAMTAMGTLIDILSNKDVETETLVAPTMRFGDTTRIPFDSVDTSQP